MKKHSFNTEFDSASLPDPSITIQEMNDYGYTWEGMLPLRDRMAFYWLDKTQIYCLYQDNTEAAVDEVFEAVRHANKGGIFGIEIESWHKILEDKQEEEELPLLNLLRKKLGLEINERFDVVDPRNGQAAAHQCFFTKQEIFDRNGEPVSSELLADLVLGFLTIQKKAWRPKHGDVFWSLVNPDRIAADTFNVQDLSQHALMQVGWCFKTEEEAKKNQERILKEVKEILKNDEKN